MKNQRKTLLSGIIAIVLGTSCCWLSTIALWTGSIGLFTLITKYSFSIQFAFLLVGVSLICIAYFRYIKSKIK